MIILLLRQAYANRANEINPPTLLFTCVIFMTLPLVQLITVVFTAHYKFVLISIHTAQLAANILFAKSHHCALVLKGQKQ